MCYVRRMDFEKERAASLARESLGELADLVSVDVVSTRKARGAINRADRVSVRVAPTGFEPGQKYGTFIVDVTKKAARELLKAVELREGKQAKIRLLDVKNGDIVLA